MLEERDRDAHDPAIPHRVHVDTWPTRDVARRMKALVGRRLWDIDTGHDLMITEPDAVAELLLRVASL